MVGFRVNPNILNLVKPSFLEPLELLNFLQFGEKVDSRATRKQPPYFRRRLKGGLNEFNKLVYAWYCFVAFIKSINNEIYR